MICSDTSSLVALFQGETGRDVELVTQALRDRVICISPVTLTELLSDAAILPQLEKLAVRIPLLDTTSGYWQRAGKLRAHMIRQRYRPKIADTLIAQSCLDHRAPLITRDADFAAFEKIASLRLL